jgi:hypothetical protein
MAIITGAELLAWMGTRNPSTADTDWADLCAAAFDQAITMYLDWPTVTPAIVPADYPELHTAALLGAGEAYRRRDAPYGTTGFVEPAMGAVIRFARDYIESVKPILFRYRNVAGLVA